MEKEENFVFNSIWQKVNTVLSLLIKISFVIITIVLSWRIAWSNIQFDLSQYTFSDLLALILALFAMAMSIVFYFKSTDSSNQFYNNVYTFTQKTSELLGRIEERFGERLKHLDEGYDKMQSRIENINKASTEIEKEYKETEDAKQKEEESIKEKEQAFNQIVEEIAKKAKLQDEEKKEFIKKVSQLTNEINDAQLRVKEISEDRDRLQNELKRLKQTKNEENKDPNFVAVKRIINNPELKYLIKRGDYWPKDFIKQRSRMFFINQPGNEIEALKKIGIIDSNLELTLIGMDYLKNNML